MKRLITISLSLILLSPIVSPRFHGIIFDDYFPLHLIYTFIMGYVVATGIMHLLEEN